MTEPGLLARLAAGMLSWLVSVALAQEVDVLLARADDLLSGPPGCWEVVAKADWDHQLGPFGSTRGGAVFVGRLEDHVWTGLEVLPTGEELARPREVQRRIYGRTPRFTPVIGGRRRLWIHLEKGELVVSDTPDSEAEPAQLVRDALEELAGGMETAWVEVEDERLVVHRTLAVTPRREAHVEHRFDADGNGPVASEVHIPHPLTVGFPPIRVKQADLWLRAAQVGDDLLPTAEALVVSFGMLGLTVTARQTVDYVRWQRCSAAPEEP